jgi:hypothetical protein
MQTYRHLETSNQLGAIYAFEQVKEFIRKYFEPKPANLVGNRVSQAASPAMPNGGLTDREKSLILWFMELAVKMKMKDYTELSIASIDLESWYEVYYLENELPGLRT